MILNIRRIKEGLSMPAAKIYRVGWRAFRYLDLPKPELIAMGRTLFPASSVEKAMEMAERQVPGMIREPGCSIGIRYVKEIK